MDFPLVDLYVLPVLRQLSKFFGAETTVGNDNSARFTTAAVTDGMVGMLTSKAEFSRACS